MVLRVAEPQHGSRTPIRGLVKSTQGRLLGASDCQESFWLNASKGKQQRQEQNENGSGNCISGTLFLAEKDENDIAEFEASMQLDHYTPDSDDDDDTSSETELSDTSDGDDDDIRVSIKIITEFQTA